MSAPDQPTEAQLLEWLARAAVRYLVHFEARREEKKIGGPTAKTTKSLGSALGNIRSLAKELRSKHGWGATP